MENDERKLENLMKSTMENLRNMINTNTVIGDPIQTINNTYIIPVSKLSFGFASGGSDFNLNGDNKKAYPFGGGSGAGVSVKPIAFLIVKDDAVRMLSVEHENTSDKLVDSIPQILDTVKNLVKDINKKKKDCNPSSEKNE